MSEPTMTNRDPRQSETQQSNAAMQAENNMASTPEPSRQQAMLYGIVGERLERITRRVPLDEPPPLPENAKLNAIGKSVPRFDAVQKVTGGARYTFDVKLPGMLYARRVVSTTPHARVKSIDTSAAERHPGVRAVHVLERARFGTAPRPEGRGRYSLPDRSLCGPAAGCSRRRNAARSRGGGKAREG
jgi:xanthine dehydrogenase YagR molybdenum-binding subunit